MSIFNTCIITASSEKQCEIYRTLINKRTKHGLYPSQIRFLVYCDPLNAQIGSGGATVLALKKYSDENEQHLENDKILIINAGDKSFKIPFFAPEGILFMPVPVSTSSVIPPVVLDLHLSFFLKYPWNDGEVVVISADVIADFDISELKENRGDICGYAVRAPLSKGSTHGVFKFDYYRSNIINYFQKADVEFLKNHATLEGTGQCAVDIGIISLSRNFIKAVQKLTTIKTAEGNFFDSLNSGSESFSIYLELITATLSGIDYQTFYSSISSRSELSKKILPDFFDILSQFHLRAILIRSALFLHLSSTAGYLNSCLELRTRDVRLFYTHDFQEILITDTPNQIIFNTNQFSLPLGNHKIVVGESIEDCTLENVIGNNLFVGISNWNSDLTIPEGICIDHRVLPQGKIKIVSGVDDTYSSIISIDKIIFCGILITQWMDERKLSIDDLWDQNQDKNLLNARLFIRECSDEFLRGYWANPIGEQWSDKFRSEDRFSILQLNSITDGNVRDENRILIRCKFLKKQILSGKGWSSLSIYDFTRTFSVDPPITKLTEFYNSTDDYFIRLYRGRLLEEISKIKVQNTFPGFPVSGKLSINLLSKDKGISLERIVSTQCPVRIDFAGGWTDLPPFTLHNGGAVVNFSADLFSKPSIQVFCKKSQDPVIKLISIDNGIFETITEFDQLDIRKGSSAFILHKSILSIAGFDRFNKKNNTFSSLSELLKNIGFGIELTTFCPIPTGSGLGTSSILASSILATLCTALGQELKLNDQISTIIDLEQRLKTGGGWQDQLGGISGGLKYIESKPGIFADPLIYRMNSSFFEENIELFTLYYSGIQRPFNNAISDVCNQMSANIPAYNLTLHYIKQLAKDCQTALETNNIYDLANIINSSRNAGDMIFPESQNISLCNFFNNSASNFLAFKFTGAGGGGYVLFISENREKSFALRNFLDKNKRNNSEVIPFSLNTKGLEITVL